MMAFKISSKEDAVQEKDPNEKCCSGFVIQKSSRNKMYWDILSNLFLVFSYFIVPLNIAFGKPLPEDEASRNLEIVLDMVILLDIIISFVTDTYSDPGQVLTNRQIAWNYMKGYFMADLLSCLPGLITLETNNGSTWIYKLKLLRYFQLTRTFNQFETQLTERLKGTKQHMLENIKMVFIVIFRFVLLFHIFACVWIILGKCNEPDNLVQCSLQ